MSKNGQSQNNSPVVFVLDRKNALRAHFIA